jgi:hypothetical protein
VSKSTFDFMKNTVKNPKKTLLIGFS